MATPDTYREPCPDRILGDIGTAFILGTVGGSAFHVLKGLYNSPNGERMVGGVRAVRMNVPRVGSRFVLWGALFSTLDCTMVYARQKEDPWNTIIAAAASGAFLSRRHGLGAASRSAMFGAVMIGSIEGVFMLMNRLVSFSASPMDDRVFPQNVPPAIPNSINSAFSTEGKS